MKCPSCGKEGCSYTDRSEKIIEDKKTKNKIKSFERKCAVPKKDRPSRQHNKAKCNKCGWEGEI